MIPCATSVQCKTSLVWPAPLGKKFVPFWRLARGIARIQGLMPTPFLHAKHVMLYTLSLPFRGTVYLDEFLGCFNDHQTYKATCKRTSKYESTFFPFTEKTRKQYLEVAFHVIAGRNNDRSGRDKEVNTFLLRSFALSPR